MLYICIVRRAKYVTIIPIAEREERPTARLTRDTGRRSPMDCFFAPPRRKRFIFFAPSERERDSKDENGTSCSSVHPSHSVLRPERRAEPQNAVRRTRTRARAPGRKPRGSLGRAGARTATTAEAGTSAGWTPLSQSRRRLGGEWTCDRAIPQQSNKPTSSLDKDDSDSATD